MSHYAIVKRQKYITKPEWKDEFNIYSGGINYYLINSMIVKYELIDFGNFTVNYSNVIININSKDSVVTHWSGRINLLPLEVGESLIVNEEKFTIKKVDKNVDGAVTYLVDDLIVKDENYDALLYECEEAYTAYSELLAYQKEKLQEPSYTYGEDDYQKELVKNKPWWIRLFE